MRGHYQQLSILLTKPNSRGLRDTACYCFRVLADIIIRDPEHARTKALQVLRPTSVVLRSIFVTHPIKLDDELRFVTIEIRHKRPDRMLSTKFQPTNLVATQQTPKDFFGRRYFTSEATSPGDGVELWWMLLRHREHSRG